MEKIKNLSVRKTILLYLAVCLVCSFFLTAVIVGIATHTQEEVWWKYADHEKYFKAMNEREGNTPAYKVEIVRPPAQKMNKRDHFISETCDFLQTYTVLVLSITTSCAAVFLFYKNKLEKPMKELDLASKRIAKNDLDFHISYENKDELGRLCQEFERMRKQLVQNNQELWRIIEEEKALRAAIAHDIRSPLSVLKGYQEMLLEYLPDGTIDIKKAMEMLTESRKQITRMNHFIETMQKMNSLEQRTLLTELITAEQIKSDIQSELAVLKLEKGKQVVLDVQKTQEIFSGDREVILEVTENLLSNALRYAKSRIEIRVFITCQELKICVANDGEGFSEDIDAITKAFHQQNVKDSLNHAGMGMYISRLYCEKHGGNLLLENRTTGGAVVTAIFHGNSS